jgi:hypothetical protein
VVSKGQYKTREWLPWTGENSAIAAKLKEEVYYEPTVYWLTGAKDEV